MEYSMSIKAVNTVERYNIDNCLTPFEGNRFRMILAASVRAREIATTRNIADKNGNRKPYPNKSVVEALCEIDQGQFGAEYLLKLK
jgi:DNA-directed RNA polymerase subunit K/omega